MTEQQKNAAIAAIREKLVEAEAAGFTDKTPEQLLVAIKNGRNN